LRHPVGAFFLDFGPLNWEKYPTKADESKKLHILGVDTALFIDTIDHNLKTEHPFTRFQRKVPTTTSRTRCCPDSDGFHPKRPKIYWRSSTGGWLSMIATAGPALREEGATRPALEYISSRNNYPSKGANNNGCL
jgi:hypothetical protein